MMVRFLDAAHGLLLRPWSLYTVPVLLGIFGAHKFYEGKIGMGILYLFTVGLFGIGWVIDLIVLLLKPNPDFSPIFL